MKELPILFSAPMVRAQLADTKTLTRRVMKVQPIETPLVAQLYKDRACTKPVVAAMWDTRALDGSTCCLCPYGVPGDRLWVRETWNRTNPGGEQGVYFYRADEAHEFRDAVWRPSIHMPRAASRITLEVTGVRVERLQDISEADAIAEGIERSHIDSLGRQQWKVYPHKDGTPGEEVVTYIGKPHTSRPIDAYRSLWLSINGPGSWDINPWVWVIEFKKVEP